MAAVTLADVQAAQRRIAGLVHCTPVFTSQRLDQLSGRKLFFKGECLQKTGAFKARGANNAIRKLLEDGETVKGVCTHSSGNHGQAVAYAAQQANLPCAVVVPRGSAKVKTDAIQGYGAELIGCEPTPDDRKATCARVSEERGYHIVHPFDNPSVIAGQGTMALELLQQVPEVDAILVPTSGGGMASGICVAVKALRPSCKVFLVEPKGKDIQPCLESGQRLWPEPPRYLDTIADALKIQPLGQLTFPILCQLAEKKVFSITDEQMKKAMLLSWQTLKLVIEPASAAGVAAALSDEMKQLDPSIKNVAVILCGGNVDLTHLFV